MVCHLNLTALVGARNYPCHDCGHSLLPWQVIRAITLEGEEEWIPLCHSNQPIWCGKVVSKHGSRFKASQFKSIVAARVRVSSPNNSTFRQRLLHLPPDEGEGGMLIRVICLCLSCNTDGR